MGVPSDPCSVCYPCWTDLDGGRVRMHYVRAGDPDAHNKGWIIVHTFEIGKSSDTCSHLMRLEQTHMCSPTMSLNSSRSEASSRSFADTSTCTGSRYRDGGLHYLNIVVHTSFTRLVPGIGRYDDELWMLVGEEKDHDWNQWIVILDQDPPDAVVWHLRWTVWWWGYYTDRNPHHTAQYIEWKFCRPRGGSLTP